MPGCLLSAAQKQGPLPPLLEASSPGCCIVCFKGQYVLYFFLSTQKPISAHTCAKIKSQLGSEKGRNWRELSGPGLRHCVHGIDFLE
jgi:hypothetical protein